MTPTGSRRLARRPRVPPNPVRTELHPWPAASSPPPAASSSLRRGGRRRDRRPRGRRGRQRSRPPPAATAPGLVRRGAPHAVDADPRAPLGRRHVDQPRGDDRPEDRAAADNIKESLAAGDRSRLHLADQHRRLPVERRRRARPRHHHAGASAPRRLVQTLNTLLRMEHHEPSGMYYNWYDEATGEVLTTWPEDGSRVYPFLSSVDNGWLGAALHGRAVRRPGRRAAGRRGCSTGCAGTCSTTPTPPTPGAPGGLIHGGFYDAPPPHRGLDLHRQPHRRRPGRLVHQPPLRHDGVRDPHHQLPRHPHRADPGQAVLRHVAHLPGELRLGLARDAAGRREPHLPGRRRLRGRLHLPRHAHRPRLGRQHVRGAHARRVRPRGELGAAQLGPQPPAARPGPA